MGHCDILMPMEIYKTEGIILNTLLYRDYDVIATVFSRDYGIIKLFIKSSLKKNGGFIEELTRAEFVYTTSKSELMPCQEITLVQSSLRLRQRLEPLEAACDMLTAIQQSQYPLKPAPKLYQLMTNYLTQLPTFSSPEALRASFKLKLLRHEGLFALRHNCKGCDKELQAFTLCHGAFFCPEHAPETGLHFSCEEADILILLGFSQDYAQLSLAPISSYFQTKINTLFQALLET